MRQVDALAAFAEEALDGVAAGGEGRGKGWRRKGRGRGWRHLRPRPALVAELGGVWILGTAGCAKHIAPFYNTKGTGTRAKRLRTLDAAADDDIIITIRKRTGLPRVRV